MQEPSLIVAVESKFKAKESVQPEQLEFQLGLVGSLGNTNISDGPNTKPLVSLTYVGMCVTKL